MQKIVILAVLAMTVSGFPSTAHAQFANQEIRLRLEQRSDELSNKQYLVSAGVSGSLANDIVVVSPSGVRFTGFSGDPVSVPTFEQVPGELFGLWTVEDTGIFGTEALETHNFTVEPFGLDSVFSASPFVVSPSDGDAVRPGFVFDWAYSTGVTEPSSRSTRITRPGYVDTNVIFGSGSEATINAVFDPGFTSASVTISAGTFETLDELVSPITTSVDTQRSSFSGELQFRNITSPNNSLARCVPSI